MRLPVTIITGFLGSGKTTLLRNLINSSKQKLAVIINEFGDIGIDGDLVKGCNFCGDKDQVQRLYELNNGCLCCTVQDDFLPTMQLLLSNSEAIEGIVIETSGLALPLPLIKALQWPEVRNKVFINSLVTVVDGEALNLGSPVGDLFSITKQQEEDPNIDHISSIDELFNDQLINSDLVLISRSDLISEESINAVRENLSNKVREGTLILPISYGNIEPSLILGINNSNSFKEDNFNKSELNPEDHHSHNHLDVFCSSLQKEVTIQYKELEVFLKDICRKFQIMRLKGRVWLQGKQIPLQIQMVGPRITTWYESIPQEKWKPESTGIDIVILSLKPGAKKAISNYLEER